MQAAAAALTRRRAGVCSVCSSRCLLCLCSLLVSFCTLLTHLLLSLTHITLSRAQVVDFNFESGVVDLTVGEALVGSLELSFQDAKTHSPSPKGGATQPWVIRRYLTTAPGRVYSLRGAKADIDAVYSTGLFEDVSIVPQEAEDSTEAHPKVRACARACAVMRFVCASASAAAPACCVLCSCVWCESRRASQRACCLC